MYIDYDDQSNYINSSFSSFSSFFWAIITVIGVAVALTSAGIFSVALEKREFEYGLFHAIGISKRRILLKGIAEVLILTLTSTIIGVAVVLITIASINELVLFERGQELYYYSDMAIISYITCQAVIVAILVMMQIRRILKSNVVEIRG